MLTYYERKMIKKFSTNFNRYGNLHCHQIKYSNSHLEMHFFVPRYLDGNQLHTLPLGMFGNNKELLYL